MKHKDLVTAFALSFLGKEYIYGGNGPYVDCSGLVIQILKSAGIGPKHDMTAQQLFEHYFRGAKWDHRDWGSLCFFGRSTNSISHVGFLLNDSQLIESAGGNSLTITKERAQEMGAFVRIRVLDSRQDLVAILGLQYPFSIQ